MLTVSECPLGLSEHCRYERVTYRLRFAPESAQRGHLLRLVQQSGAQVTGAAWSQTRPLLWSKPS